MKKATIHRPSSFDPAQYEVVNFFDNRRPEYIPGFHSCLEQFLAELSTWVDTKKRLFPRGNCHSCEHCGQTNVRYVASTRHIPTGEVVCFGHKCVERLELSHDEFRAKHIRTHAANMAAAAKRAKARQEFLAANPKFAMARRIFKSLNPERQRKVSFFVHDVFGKFDRYDGLSEKQMAAVVTGMIKELKRFAKQRRETTAALDAPEGKVQVRGTILSIKVQDSFYGLTEKMLLRIDDDAFKGSKGWLTVPASLGGVERGDEVELTATWTRSDTDSKFALGRRPSKARRLTDGIKKN
jgi:hypothetical protein